MIETKFKSSIPDGWEVKKIGEVATICGGGTPSTNVANYWGGKINWFTPAEISEESGYVFSSERKITEEGLKNSSAKLLPKGSVLLTTRATIGNRAIAGCEVCTNQGFQSLIPKDIYNIFLYYNIATIVQDMRTEASGSTFLEISGKKLSEIQFIVPPSTEQTRIATALSDIDDLIATTKKLIEKKRNIKEGAMQELLSGKRRLPGFTEEWVEGIVSENVVFYKGTGLSKSKLVPNGKYPCILYGEIFTTYNYEVIQCVSHTNSNEGTPSVKGDVLMPASTTTKGIDLAKAVCLYEDDVLLGGDIIIMRNDFGKFYPLFFSYYITEIMPKQVEEVAQGTTIIHLQPSKLGKLSIRIPTDLKEQKAIADVLSDMESEIQVLEKRLAKYKDLKQGMMQQLLTGKIRLI